MIDGIWHVEKREKKTFSEILFEQQVCSSHLSSAPSVASWSLSLNVLWSAEHPVLQPNTQSQR